MELKEVNAFILDFLKTTEVFFGPHNVTITARLDAAIFPVELDKFEGKRSGLRPASPLDRAEGSEGVSSKRSTTGRVGLANNPPAVMAGTIPGSGYALHTRRHNG